MYLYSPILFDSQELILFYLSTRSSCHARAAPESSTTIVPDPRNLGNGDAYDQLPSQLPGSCRCSMYTLILQGSVGFQQWNGDADLKFTNSCCGTSMLLYIPYVGWPLVMQVENVDDVAPATPGALRTRIHDVGKKGRFLVMEMDWRASRLRCGTSS